jgi:retron-type reverse transcriptase
VSAELASPTGRKRVVVPRDKVRALQHTFYRAAKADPGRRFHTLWDKVLCRDVLWRGWVAVRRNDGASGIDKLTLDAVEEYGIDRFLTEIQSELREGQYRPLPARQVLIPKPGQPGQTRPLAIASVRDRVVQAALKIVFEPILRRTFCRAVSGFGRDVRRTTPCTSSITRPSGVGCGWSKRTSRTVLTRFRKTS